MTLLVIQMIKQIFLYVFLINLSNGQECKTKELPYKVSVDSGGKAKLSCQNVNCVENGSDQPQCSNSYKPSCDQQLEWVSGFQQISKSIQLKCCKYSKMKDATYLTQVYIKPGQSYQTGYHSDANGRQTSYDVIKNITADNQGFHLWIYRMRCIPPARESKKAAKRHGSSSGQGGQSVPRVRGRGGGTGGGAGGCFAPNVTSFVKDKGWIRMADVKIGDLVLTASEDNVLSYQPITCFFHKDRHQWADYLTIYTEPGSTLTLTPAHVIYATNCYNNCSHFKNFETKFASEIQIGDCLLSTMDNKLIKTKVTNITSSTIMGVYSPMTTNGVIVANGIVSSCFSFVKDDTLLRSVYTALFKLQSTFEAYFNRFNALFFESRSEIEFVDVPSVATFLLDIINELLPSTNQLKLF